MASWDDLKPREPDAKAPNELDDACAAALTTPAGRRLMDVLRKQYIEHVASGMPDVRALDRFDAKRQLVRSLEDATARGLAALQAKARPKT